MKLLEKLESIQPIKLYEEVENGTTLKKIEGIVGMADIINRNGRFYSSNTYAKMIERAQEKIKEGKLLGEIDHPEYEPSLLRAAVRYTDLWMEGNLVKYRAVILPTPHGELLEKLIKSGVGVGNSTRGYGTVTIVKMEGRDVEYINDDYVLEGIDFVLEQSNPYGKPTKIESSQKGGNKMTLEELKNQQPELVDELTKEIRQAVENELRDSLKNEIMESLNEDLKTKIEEAKEEARKEILEKEDVKLAINLINTIKEGFNPENINAEMKERLESLEKEVEELRKEKEQLAEEKAIAESKLQGYLDEKEKESAIEEAVKDYKYADALREQLKECKTAEEVRNSVGAKKAFIESLVTKVMTSNDNNGKGKVFSNDSTTLNEDVERLRKLAGIE